ncbi:MAG: diguanylate cyclase [Nannocystaceae bacterium]
MGSSTNREAPSDRPSSVRTYPWENADLISFVTHPGVGRVLCVGSGLTSGVREILSRASYEVGDLPISIEVGRLPQAASTFLPDLIYVDLSANAEAGLEALSALAQDPRTEELPLVGLLLEEADELLIDDAYTRSGCDFFRVAHTTVELLARTHLLVRMSRPANQLVPSQYLAPPRATAANDPGTGVDLEDPVTGLYSPSYFIHRLPTEISRARRYSRELCLVVLRCPAAQNDEAVSVQVASILRKHMRAPDVGAQLDSDVFAILLPEALHDGLEALRARIRRDLNSVNLKHGFGVTALDREHTASPVALLNLARDQADRDLERA